VLQPSVEVVPGSDRRGQGPPPALARSPGRALPQDNLSGDLFGSSVATAQREFLREFTHGLQRQSHRRQSGTEIAQPPISVNTSRVTVSPAAIVRSRRSIVLPPMIVTTSPLFRVVAPRWLFDRPITENT